MSSQPRPVQPRPARRPWPDPVGVGLVVVTTIALGAGPTFGRLAFDGGSGPLTLQLLRFALAFLAVTVLAAAIRHRPAMRRGHLVRLAWLAAMTALTSYCYITAVKYIAVALASLTFFTFPLMVAILSHLLGQERLTALGAVAVATAFGGLALVLAPDLDTAHAGGLALAFIAGAGVAVAMLISRTLSRELSSLTITLVVTGAPVLLFGLLALALDGGGLPATAGGWLGAIGLALCYTIGLICLYAGIRRLGPLQVSVIANLEPLFSVLFAFLVLGELLAPLQLIGVGIVIAGILLMQVRPAPGAG